MNLFSRTFTFDYSTHKTEGVQYIDKSGLSKALTDKLTPLKKYSLCSSGSENIVLKGIKKYLCMHRKFLN